MTTTSLPFPAVHPPKLPPGEQWRGFPQRPWLKKDRDAVTVLYSFVERRKSYFLRAFFKRKGLKYIDMGDHIKKDVSFGKSFGNRMQCNPLYFTSGSFIRHLFEIEKETGLSKKEIAERYVFLCGGGQCGPCRYGLYPQEYLKAANDAGFKGMRLLSLSAGVPQGGQRRRLQGHAAAHLRL
jgi:predicted nucleotide-binding protein (sugar kinase/HSP70/actin superfamily)